MPVVGNTPDNQIPLGCYPFKGNLGVPDDLTWLFYSSRSYIRSRDILATVCNIYYLNMIYYLSLRTLSLLLQHCIMKINCYTKGTSNWCSFNILYYVSSALIAKTSFTLDSGIITSVPYPEREKSLSRLISNNLQTLMTFLLNMSSTVLC